MNYNEIGIYDIELVRGTPEDVPFYGWEKDGEEWDLEQEEVKVQVKASIDVNRYAELTLTVANGGLTVAGNSVTLHFKEDTAKLQGNVYYYDISIGEKPYVGGKVIMTGKVTSDKEGSCK